LCITCVSFITHLSKIFNFLSSGTYSSLGVNFFRFPLESPSPEWVRRKLEEQSKMQKAIKDAEDAIASFNAAQTPESRENYLNIIEFHYGRLKGYEEYKQARETREELFKILKENGRYPEEDKKEDKEE